MLLRLEAGGRAVTYPACPAAGCIHRAFADARSVVMGARPPDPVPIAVEEADPDVIDL
jgi:hypothetical protein